ncbi:mRNA surveillance protein pelota [Desulfurococcus mucosus]|uniref:Protein pelota homolog n=1 Tax=Desulfurococcus mucosus (strain ATCC 35584 / DSM 2162 / JCM 9187 / O7/1) TaxID=765177 RepID=E8R7B3_DESM0|nr:mRNA surveillance protein pelota [Desulfurococcus mucosus]ADV65578.1 cell division protein pelota [Desulfurococcus mucosus DSM 2162]
MKVLEEDLRNGYVRILVEDRDDLWVLFMVLRKGDVVYARTTREVKPGEGGSSRRIPMTLGVRVEAVEFQEFTERLRIRGVVVEGPEEYGVKGHYHTINVSPGDQLTIVRDSWSRHSLDLLKKSVKRKRVLLVVLDYEDACIAVLTEQGVKYVNEVHSELPGKMYRVNHEKAVEDYLSEVVSASINTVQQEGVDAVIAAGPGDLKNRVAEALKTALRRHVYVDSTSTGGCQGVAELLRRDVVKQAVGELSLVKAGEILEEFKRLIVKDPELVAYGVDDVYEAASYGSVSKLVVVHEMLHEADDERRSRVYEVLEKAHETGGEVVIVPGRSDVGAEIQGFGGVIAVLRYRLFRG